MKNEEDEGGKDEDVTGTAISAIQHKEVGKQGVQQ